MSEERTPRTPPRNEEAERALLGALLLDDDRVAEVADFLRAEAFYDRRHGLIFEGILRLAGRHTPVNFVSLGEALRADGSFSVVGGPACLVQLAQEVTSSAHALHHAHIVADTSALRGAVYESEYLGTTQIVAIEVKGAIVKARVPSDRSYKVGENLGLTFEAPRLSLFDSTSGRAIRTSAQEEPAHV